MKANRAKALVLVVVVVSGLSAMPANASATLNMVKDINRGSGSSNPDGLIDVNGTLFFSADDSATGWELWKSDGTTASTVLVKDINPGVAGSDAGAYGAAANVNGTLFFGASDGVTGAELWKSDGTAAGTVLVKDINPLVGPWGSSNPRELTDVNGTLFFVADDGTGRELWKSDGTAAGTEPLGEVAGELANVNGTLFFSGLAGELWKSDGTAAGTVLVRGDISGEYLSSLTVVNGSLFFTAGYSLWKSDGTAAGTVEVGSIGNYYLPSDLTNVNGTLFLIAHVRSSFYTSWGQEYYRYDDQLWKSDGTTDGTVMVKDGFAERDGGGNIAKRYLTNVNGTLFFSADGGAGSGYSGTELWKSDGTGAGTVLVKDINPTSSDSSSPSFLTDVGGRLFFSAYAGDGGEELWESDGTPAGTVQVDDINQTSYWTQDENTGERVRVGGTYASSTPQELTNVNGTLFFVATDGRKGRELWTAVPCPSGVSKSGNRCL